MRKEVLKDLQKSIRDLKMVKKLIKTYEPEIRDSILNTELMIGDLDDMIEALKNKIEREGQK